MNATTLNDLKNHIDCSGIADASLSIERHMSLGQLLSYRSCIEINECGEELVEVIGSGLETFTPHPHLSIGAPYGDYSPTCVRSGVLDRLHNAQFILNDRKPGYLLKIYDAYRPLSVQAFMIEHEFSNLCEERGIQPSQLTDSGREELINEVLMVWAKPDENPLAPPPHSTGAAVDLTIVDADGKPINMGSEIDAIGRVSLPNHFLETQDETEASYRENRELLCDVMTEVGFRRIPHEWWHFSYGDQIWALLQCLDNREELFNAIYGRV